MNDKKDNGKNGKNGIRKKYLQHIAYSLGIIAAATSNLWTDKTQSQQAVTAVADHQIEFVKYKTTTELQIKNLQSELEKFKSFNYGLINNRLGNLEESDKTFKTQLDELKTTTIRAVTILEQLVD